MACNILSLFNERTRKLCDLSRLNGGLLLFVQWVQGLFNYRLLTASSTASQYPQTRLIILSLLTISTVGGQLTAGTNS